MQRFAQILCAGAIALALIAGGPSALVAHAEEMTIQGEGYIGFSNDISSSSSSSSSSTTSTSSSGGGSSSGGASGASSSASSGTASSASSGAATSSGGADSSRPAESNTAGQGGGSGQGNSGGQGGSGNGGGTNAGSTGSWSNALPAGWQMTSAAEEAELEEPAEEAEPEDELPAEEVPLDTIELEEGDSAVPLTSVRGRGWGVVNLALILLTFGAAVYLFAVLRKRRGLAGASFVAGASGLLPAVLFALLEDFGTVRMVTRWTPLFIVLAVVYLVSAIVVHTKILRPNIKQ